MRIEVPREFERLGAVRIYGLQKICRHGGRFRTVTGMESDKGRAARLVAGLYAVALGQRVVTAGIGDSANDEGLLTSADHPYLVARGAQTWAQLDIPGLVRTADAGPRGWNEAIQHLLATQRA